MKCRKPLATAGKDVRNLHHHNPDEHHGGRLDVQRICERRLNRLEGLTQSPSPLDENREVADQYGCRVGKPKEDIATEKKKPVNDSLFSVAWRMVHHTRLGLFDPESESRQRLGSEVDSKNLKRRDRRGNPEENVQDEGNGFGDQVCEDVGDEFLDVGKDRPSLLDCSDNAREVVV